jgi:hypothetical protein
MGVELKITAALRFALTRKLRILPSPAALAPLSQAGVSEFGDS